MERHFQSQIQYGFIDYTKRTFSSRPSPADNRPMSDAVPLFRPRVGLRGRLHDKRPNHRQRHEGYYVLSFHQPHRPHSACDIPSMPLPERIGVLSYDRDLMHIKQLSVILVEAPQAEPVHGYAHFGQVRLVLRFGN